MRITRASRTAGDLDDVWRSRSAPTKEKRPRLLGAVNLKLALLERPGYFFFFGAAFFFAGAFFLVAFFIE